jgi:hypothetical protein
MDFVVIGGSGPTGSKVVDTLVEHGHQPVPASPPNFKSESPSIPADSDAYIPVRVRSAPFRRIDARLPSDGTAFVVNGQQLLRLELDFESRG